MSKAPTLPTDPIGRFCAIARALASHKRWSDDWSCLRYASQALLVVDGDAKSVANRLYAFSDELKDLAGWFSPLRSSIRFCVAAMLLRAGDRAQAFLDEVARVQRLFRDTKIGRGSTFEFLAILILRDGNDGGLITREQVQRFQEIHTRMKADHRWLTGTDDYPACALLTAADESPTEMGPRLESFYLGLHQRGFKKGNRLQTASHVLYFNPAPDRIAMERFDALFQGFKQAGLRMNEGDYDELAILSFLEHGAGEVVRRVAQHRVQVEGLKPRPDKNTSFSLACGTVFLELAQLDRDLQRLHDVSHIVSIQAILQAQQAAVAAAAASASAAAAS